MAAVYISGIQYFKADTFWRAPLDGDWGKMEGGGGGGGGGWGGEGSVDIITDSKI